MPDDPRLPSWQSSPEMFSRMIIRAKSFLSVRSGFPTLISARAAARLPRRYAEGFS
jgi:hypothetical protein